jgi:S-adenosylmethionine:tRNA ribosyltransferase-isomerase
VDVKDFDFYLPEELIAQTPLVHRAESRLLVLNRQTGDVQHHRFDEVDHFFNAGDLLVLNDTRVIPARLFGVKKDTGAKAEVLLLKALEGDRWEALVRPGKRLKVGSEITFGNDDLLGYVVEETEMGGRIIRFEYKGIFHEILDRLGHMPLPPYIKETLDDRERYQTVYSKHLGSAAAPTAGLHFTSELLTKLEDKGVRIAYITLHVGLGTFRPVSVDRIEDHAMHAEYYEVPEETARLVADTRAGGGRVITVGTTSTRTLEAVASQHGKVVAASGWTDIFIFPGYTFKAIDGMITNFHLPQSTLVMLVSALAGRENIIHAYEEAIRERYRFFSFGDAMIIL